VLSLIESLTDTFEHNKTDAYTVLSALPETVLGFQVRGSEAFNRASAHRGKKAKLSYTAFYVNIL
jgi:hypothetical protein